VEAKKRFGLGFGQRVRCYLESSSLNLSLNLNLMLTGGIR